MCGYGFVPADACEPSGSAMTRLLLEQVQRELLQLQSARRRQVQLTKITRRGAPISCASQNES